MKIRYIIIGNEPGKEDFQRIGTEYGTPKAAMAARTRFWKRRGPLTMTIIGTASFTR
jgi:hypothetical protein